MNHLDQCLVWRVVISLFFTLVDEISHMYRVWNSFICLRKMLRHLEAEMEHLIVQKFPECDVNHIRSFLTVEVIFLKRWNSFFVMIENQEAVNFAQHELINQFEAMLLDQLLEILPVSYQLKALIRARIFDYSDHFLQKLQSLDHDDSESMAELVKDIVEGKADDMVQQIQMLVVHEFEDREHEIIDQIGDKVTETLK